MNKNHIEIDREIEDGFARPDKMLKRQQAFKIIGTVVLLFVAGFLLTPGFSGYRAVSAEKTATVHLLLTSTALAFQNETATQQVVQLTEASSSTAIQRVKDAQATATVAFFRVFATRTEKAVRIQVALTRRAKVVLPILESVEDSFRTNKLVFPENAILQSGPEDGNLAHEDDGYIKSSNAGIASKNFIASVEFENPYNLSKGIWHYGL